MSSDAQQGYPYPIKGNFTRRQQYEICLRRGHVPTSFSPFSPRGGDIEQSAIRIRPIRSAERDSISGWLECYYCGVKYQYVTKIEEEGVPAP